jgi:hypothetical protein
LIVEDEVADGLRQLSALPLALQPAGVLFASRGGGTRRLDGVGGGAQFMGGDMSHRCRLAGCIGSMASSSP